MTSLFPLTKIITAELQGDSTSLAYGLYAGLVAESLCPKVYKLQVLKGFMVEESDRIWTNMDNLYKKDE